jgi:hypothetical protein
MGVPPNSPGNGCLASDRNWIIGKGGTKKGAGKGRVGEEVWGCWVLWLLCVFGCISTVVVEGAVLGIAGGWGVCTVGIVG